MTDRPPPEQDREPDTATPSQAPVAPEAASPEPDASSATLASRQFAQPPPEPESPQSRETVEAEPHTSVDAVAEPSAPAQIAPEPFGSSPSQGAPIPSEPGPSVPEPVSPESGAPVALAAETDQTLALPPTTKEVEPPPVPSTPPPPTGVPVPFAAPPTGHSRYFGLKLGLGIGGGALAVIGVVVAVVVALIVFTNSITDKVEGTAEEFIGAVAEDDWDTAYAMLCADYRQRPVEDYTDEWDSWDVEGAEVQPMNAATGNVTVEFDDGSAIELVIAVEQTTQTLDTSVCGWRSVTV